jgi:hypothetical protein
MVLTKHAGGDSVPAREHQNELGVFEYLIPGASLGYAPTQCKQVIRLFYSLQLCHMKDFEEWQAVLAYITPVYCQTHLASNVQREVPESSLLPASSFEPASS